MQTETKIAKPLSVFLLLALALTVQAANASTRRAVVIGIDKYAPAAPKSGETTSQNTERSGWYDLDGAVNDAMAMRDVLSLHGFESDNVAVLLNEDASREAILEALRSVLVEQSEPGDIAFFYFAGHGSQVANSSEVDGLDETLVPADANEGAWDIRDKELRRIFGDVLDRGAQLVAVVDACHSGGISRGFPAGKTRALSRDPRDIAGARKEEPADRRPPPGDRGALIMSASQSHQYALEARDETGMAHGLFTLTLLRALRSASPDESADSIIQRTKAYILAEGQRQQPSADASIERLGSPFFGGESKVKRGSVRVPVTALLPNGEIELAAGIALRLGPGSILVNAEHSDVKIRILRNDGVSRSVAERVTSDGSPTNVGDVFELEQWIPPMGAQLSVWAATPVSNAKLDALTDQLARVRDADCIRMVDDPTGDHSQLNIATWNGNGWTLRTDEGLEIDLGKKLSKRQLCSRLAGGGEKNLFVSLPPSTALLEQLRFVNDSASAIELTSDIRAAHYILAGRFASSREYAFVLPSATRPGSVDAALPKRTDWIAEKDGAVLDNYAKRLARLRAWLTLEPPGGSVADFPYDLALKSGERYVDTPNASIVDGEIFELVLRMPPNAVRDSRARGHYVYVFAMDSAGNRSLLFPGPQQGIGENFLPAKPTGRWPEEIPLGVRIMVSPPYGLDTYFMLFSREPLPNPAVLQAQGVVRGGGSESPLGALLQSVNSTRGTSVVTPVNWSISRIPFRSMPNSP